MDLSKYTGSVPNGDHPARITAVTAEKAKDGTNYNLVFNADLIDCDVKNRMFRRSLKESALPILRDDLQAAEVLREGDAYPTDPHALAEEIAADLSDRTVTLRYKDGKNGYQDIRIVGLSLEAA
ncbi:MAG: hypothetical protein KGL39_12745 [Patescibacteria group bacterium]|nr:hypothetical protein [Patescibacteria group bacterium]